MAPDDRSLLYDRTTEAGEGGPLARCLYENAVIHVAWVVRRGVRSLVFAWVELLPVEVPSPPDDGELTRPKPLRGGARIYVRHLPTTAQRALRWYRECASGRTVRPNLDGALPQPDELEATLLPTAELLDEPAWPSMTCSGNETERLPFVAGWHDSPRLHHLVPSQPQHQAVLGLKERQDAYAWLSDSLGCDLGAHEELIGSVHLLLPNPYLRRVRERLIPGEPDEGVNLHPVPRWGQKLDGLCMQVTHVRGMGHAQLVHISPLSETLLRVAGRVADIGIVVATLSGDVIHVSDPVGFIASVHIGMQMVVSERRVEVPPVGDRPGETYSVGVHTGGESIKVGEAARSLSGAVVLAGYRDRIKRKVQGERLEQRWFKEQVEEAVRVIRDKIGKAKRQVLVVDPYLGWAEFRRFLLAVQDASVPIRAVTSKRAFAGKDGDAQIRRLSTDLQLSGVSLVNRIALRVMVKMEVHDRFMVIDGRVFLLGSSLNQFGSQGTMMVALPDPAYVEAELEAVWSKATDFVTWTKGRQP